MTLKKSNPKQSSASAEKKDKARTADPTKLAIDPVVFGHVMAQATERALPLLQEYMEKMGKDTSRASLDPLNLQETYKNFLTAVMSNPQKLVDLQVEYWNQWAQLWQTTLQKMHGEKTADLYQPDPGDRRFKSSEWQENTLFDFIKQSYLMTSRWMHKVVRTADGLDQDTLNKLEFSTKQFADAMAPTNFVMTNPDVLRETIRTGGENLVRGLENLLEDLERGHGEVKISTTNYDAFTIGENLAATPGRVIFQNDLMQLIQYNPTTPTVSKTPLLVVPPWINKYYILDMRKENSFIGWLVDQGHTVFVVSWVNPGAELGRKDFSDYMKEGIITALDVIEKETSEKSTNVIGYCIGGTLLTITLAWLKAKGMEKRINSATFLTTLIDFENAGELKLFTDEKQISAMEKEMAEKGFLAGDYLQKTFSLLRSNDMIWSFVINNYLLGREPFPFDLLYWNEDTTNMPGAMHSFYLRNMYLENKLIRPGALAIDGVKIDVHDLKTPSYFLSTREDHIAPWKATFSGFKAFSGPKKFTLSASGHVAGIVNPPAAQKYCFWTSSNDKTSPEEWQENAAEIKGSWWIDWQNWIKFYAGPEVPARKPAQGLEAAPGSFAKKTNFNED